MSTINGKLITPMSDDTDRIEKVEKKVNSVVVSLSELIDYSNKESERSQQTLAKVSNLHNRLQIVESKQKKSGIKTLVGINLLIITAAISLFAGNLLQINSETLNNWQTVIESFTTEN